MKILISSCLLGNAVRWNGAQKLNEKLLSWCGENGIELIPVCPENELYGTPRSPIRLTQIEDKTCAMMNGKDILDELDKKCSEIYDRHPDADGFIGISRSPSCGINVGVKGLGRTIKGSMHKVSKIPTTETSQIKHENAKRIFLKRIEKRRNCV